MFRTDFFYMLIDLNIRPSNMNYQDINYQLNIVPLEDRCSHIDLLLYKILNGEINSEHILGDINFHVLLSTYDIINLLQQTTTKLIKVNLQL